MQLFRRYLKLDIYDLTGENQALREGDIQVINALARIFHESLL